MSMWREIDRIMVSRWFEKHEVDPGAVMDTGVTFQMCGDDKVSVEFEGRLLVTVEDAEELFYALNKSARLRWSGDL